MDGVAADIPAVVAVDVPVPSSKFQKVPSRGISRIITVPHNRETNSLDTAVNTGCVSDGTGDCSCRHIAPPALSPNADSMPASKLITIAPLSLLVLLLSSTAGCLSLPQIESSSAPSASPVASASLTPAALPDPSTPLTATIADSLMGSVVEAINQEQAEVLLPYLLERDQDVAQVQAAIEDFQVYFADEPIQGFERLPNSTNQRFNYRIFNASGISKELSIIQDETTQSIRIVDEFLLYSRWAKALMERYCSALKTQDAASLARTLNADDLPYPVAGAEEAIETYTTYFDVSTLQCQFVGLQPDQGFTYRISGSQSTRPVEHFVQVIYGDGLVSVQDDFVPDQAENR